MRPNLHTGLLKFKPPEKVDKTLLSCLRLLVLVQSDIIAPGTPDFIVSGKKTSPTSRISLIRRLL